MDAERWQKIKSVFDTARELDPAKRSVYVADACVDDPELLAEVNKLLNSFENAESFIEEPAASEFASLIIESKTLKTGQRFAHYEILRLIGAGGMGEVYLATDEKLDRVVAIKLLNEEFSRHESHVQRFIQEAKAASSLNHPNILVIHEINVGDDANYIVSEFVEGKTLRDVIRTSNLKPSEMLDIAIQISGALAAAHGANIVHRDIKPENVVVRPDGYVKVLDFGLAKLIQQNAVGLEEATAKQNQTAKGLIMGTVNYMSPEQAKGEKVDQRTDIFSLGAVIYELIAGRTPFQGNSMSETFANLIKIDPQPLSRYASNVQDELQRIVSKTLRKNKDDRYQTMKGLLADLKALREDLHFDERLERSHSSDDKNATAILPATTGNVSNRTGETSNNTARRANRVNSISALVVVALLIAAVSTGYYLLSVRKTGSEGKKSLAVLPFVNATQDPNAEHLSDGITESIINNLSQLASLRVMPRNSAFRFKRDQADVKNIASQLGVEALVTGDIKQLGDKLVINVRLIDAKDESQIWGNQYVRPTTDILTAQSEIAQAVVQNLRLKLTATETQLLNKRYTENAEAWQLYQRGRFHVFKLTPPEIELGISYFQQAIEMDPNYALAYAGLSDAYRSLAIGSEMPPVENLAKSKIAGVRSIEIDDSLSEGHTGLGMTIFWGEWDWVGSEAQLKRALELNPNDATAHLFYAHILSNTGRHTEALAEVKLSRELDPLFPFAGALEGQFLFHAGRTDEALVRLQKTFDLAPTFWMPHLFASSAYIEKGMYAEAIAEARKATDLSPSQTNSIVNESYAQSKLGKHDEAQALLDKLLKRSAERFVPPGHIAQTYNGLGETEKALDWLEQAFEQHDPKMVFLKVDPKWNNLRSEPRFIDLMKRMKFDQ